MSKMILEILGVEHMLRKYDIKAVQCYDVLC